MTSIDEIQKLSMWNCSVGLCALMYVQSEKETTRGMFCSDTSLSYMSMLWQSHFLQKIIRNSNLNARISLCKYLFSCVSFNGVGPNAHRLWFAFKTVRTATWHSVGCIRCHVPTITSIIYLWFPIGKFCATEVCVSLFKCSCDMCVPKSCSKWAFGHDFDCTIYQIYTLINLQLWQVHNLVVFLHT